MSTAFETDRQPAIDDVANHPPSNGMAAIGRPMAGGPAGPVLDKPLIGFFALAYALAWGIWLLEVSLARTTGTTTADFVAAVEDGDFELVSRSEVPGWLLYLMTRVQDFSFTIAGFVIVVATTGTGGLLTLKNRLLKFNIPPGAYLLALAPVALYGLRPSSPQPTTAEWQTWTPTPCEPFWSASMPGSWSRSSFEGRWVKKSVFEDSLSPTCNDEQARCEPASFSASHGPGGTSPRW